MTCLVTTNPDGFTPMDVSYDTNPDGFTWMDVSSECTVAFLRSDNIAAIDFGTTFCSLAYTTRGDSEISVLTLCGIYKRVPIAILLEKGVDKCRVVEFGYRAQDAYARLRPNDCVNYIYFEMTKMISEKDEVSKPTTSRLSLLVVID